MVASLVILIGVCLLGAFFFKGFFTTQTGGHSRNITDIENSYQADEEFAQAMVQMKNSQEKAALITRNNNVGRTIALTFDGLTDRTKIDQILDVLKKYDSKATFFVDGMQTAEDPQTVVNIKKAGQRIENYTLSGLGKMEKFPTERLVKDFCRAQKIITVTTDQGPNLLKCNDTNYTEELLQVAKACGFKNVVKSDAFLNVKKINSADAADAFVGKLKAGSIVSIKLKANNEPIENEKGKTDLKPAIDKQPGLKELPQQVEMEDKELVEAVEKLIIALKKAKYTTSYVEEFSANNTGVKPITTTFLQNSTKATTGNSEAEIFTKMAYFIKEQIAPLFTFRTAYAAENMDHNANEIKVITTTEPAIAYTFGGISKEVVVNDVLGKLNDLGIKGTFFVMEVEMQKYPQTIRRIIENGHEVGIGIRPKDGETTEQIQSDIMRCRTALQEQFGVTTNLVKQPWGAVTEATKEAVSNLDCKLIGQSINVVQSKHKEYSSADQVMTEIFGKSTFSLARGQIVHFRMDYYTNENLIIDLLELIKKRKVDNIAYVTFYDNPANNLANDSQYVIKPVGEILNNTKFTYQYPVDKNNVPARLRNDGPSVMVDQHNFLTEVSKRYIGNEDVVYEDRMLGFSKMDARRLDTTGLVYTEDNVVFLTFDDWGTDAAINKILYVLRKHHVEGTFFVLTHNVLNNQNLLRTIAMQGNDIGSHSDNHKPMVVRDPKTGKQMKTQDQKEYSKDLATAYQKLRDVTGDVTINGKPSLTRFFRPPTLAISKMGVETLFETGYEYIISGSCSTYDYKAKNVPELVETIKDGIYTKQGELKKGTILTMHMGDSCIYTPVALDILLTANEAKADSDPSKFRVGRLSDYLIDGYLQSNRKESLKLSSHDSVQK
jgi:peptidoglycan/xylan/chitin deacetylase (PgdA/CDA1 family)